MKIPDANVLLYASDTSSSHHRIARRWLENALSGSEAVGFALVVLLAFVRIATNPRIMARPVPPGEAFALIDEWVSQAAATTVHPGRRHLTIWRELVEATGTAGNLTTDAHLAALALELGATLASFDGDFHRFAGLDLEYLA